jgi:hypothetical protein
VAFPLRYTGIARTLLRLLGLGPSRSGVRIEGDQVTVRMGWAFVARFPRTSVRSIARDDKRVWEWGVHGWRGHWLVNGSSSGLVRLELEPSPRGRTLLFPLRLKVLRVSVERPDELVATLRS